MSQDELLNILKDNPKVGFTAKDLMLVTGIGSSIFTNLRKLRKSREIEYRVRLNSKGRKKIYYYYRSEDGTKR